MTIEKFYRSRDHDLQRDVIKEAFNRDIRVAAINDEIAMLIDRPPEFRTKAVQRRIEALYKQRERALRPYINRRAEQRYESDHGNKQMKRERQREYYLQNRAAIIARIKQFIKEHKAEYNAHVRAYEAGRRKRDAMDSVGR